MSTQETLSEMQTVEKQMVEIIKTRTVLAEKQEELNRLLSATEMFENLVSKGVISKRGYNLMGAETVHSQSFLFQIQS